MGLFSSIEELGKKVKEGNIFHDLGNLKHLLVVIWSPTRAFLISKIIEEGGLSGKCCSVSKPVYQDGLCLYYT
jgi:hypothetical protein